tara:strand:- start:7660 stop:8316 length:657 start_codon:yes stop_codon:yes gene_type:complete
MAANQPILKFDSKRYLKAQAKVPNLLRTSLGFRFQKIGDEFERLMDRRFTGKPSGALGVNNTKNKLINRTGSLRRSMSFKVLGASTGTADGLVLRSSIGNARTANYVFTQEFGATIKAKGDGWLTIPLPDNKTAAGRVRFKKASDVPGLFKITANGKQFLVRKSLSGEGLDFMFILKKEVTIPARLGFTKTWRSKAMRRFRAVEIDAGIRKALSKAGL